MSKFSEGAIVEELVKYMRALVLLQLGVAARVSAGSGAGPAATVRSEVLLARSGFSHREIAEMIGKTPAAVAKAISRAKLGVTGETEPTAEVTDG
jgi:DNA-binding CsgD family transcriptional regulator